VPARIDRETGQVVKGRDLKREQQTKSALYHLTPAELRFVQAMATGKTHAEAAIEAGYRGDGNRARVRGWRLMQKPVIRAAVYELMSQAFDKASIEVTQWLREVATIAFMPAEMVDGKPKWSDKTAMLRMVGEYQKLLEKNAPSASPVNIINLITQAAAIAKLAPAVAQSGDGIRILTGTDSVRTDGGALESKTG
jgi:hypothetical protein